MNTTNNYYPNNSFQNTAQNPPGVSTPQVTPNMNLQADIDSILNNNMMNNNLMDNPTHVQYADNIFLLNVGRRVTVYLSYPDSIEWRDKSFTGTIVDAGRDYLLLNDDDNQSVLLWLIYINYAIFEGDIKHNYQAT